MESVDRAGARAGGDDVEATLRGLVEPVRRFLARRTDPATADDVLSETLSGSPGVQSVVDQRSYLDQIFRILSAASYTALGIAALMLVAAVLLIATTIRLSAFSRRREIGIMRLVGASNRFIQTPFIIEGVIAALIGAVLSAVVITVIVQVFVRGALQNSIQSINFVSMEQAWPVIPLIIVIGVALAAISANFAIKRYLRV